MAYLPSVSVVVPVYNAEDTIEECVSSLLKLDYPEDRIELVFVNNASTDQTLEILRRYSQKIKLLYEGKKGAAAARNKGVLNSSAEIIAFTDSDCQVDKNWLKNIVSPLQDVGIGAVGGRILSKRPYNKIEKFGEEIHDHDKAINEFKPPYVITMNWASRRSVLMDLGLFDEAFIRGQDVDLSRKIIKAGYTFFYQPEAVIYHSNERTFSGLFSEGYLHGFWSVKHLKKWNDYVGQSGHRKFNIKTYKDIIRSLIDYLKGQDRDNNICYFVFNTGKKIGKLFGSIRFLYIDL